MTKNEAAVLAILKQNARLSNADIASQIGLKEKEVADIISTFETSGVIVNYTTVIDDSKLDKKEAPIKALIEVRVRPEKTAGYQSIARRIARYSQVVDHYLISGNYDFLLVVEGESLEEISNFVSEKLASLENVTTTVTHFIMHRYKEKGIAFGDNQSLDRLVVNI